MKAPIVDVRPSSFWLCLIVALLAAGIAVVLLEPFQTANGNIAVVTYTRGVLHVTIPYHAVHSGDGKLTVEVLDPEDNVLGHAETQVAIREGYGRWQEDIRLDKALGADDLVWHRVRYRYVYDDQKPALEGTESISQILRTPVVHILGQQSYLSGGPAAVRVIVTDSKNEAIAGAGSVRIELAVGEQKPRALYTGRLNRRGTTEAQFRFPARVAGSQQLRYVVDTPIGSTESTQAVRLEDKVSILLTTEKPIYQPSQTIHVRALALDRANHEAAANRKLTFEVEDPRGNKVFKKATETDKFGIASAEFTLADEVNLGTYHLRALLGEAEAAPPNMAEIALNVERYVLPKFKVAVEFAGNGKKTKRGYRPGDHVKGTVRANYLFGKPVDGAEISVKASSVDVAVFEVGSVQGKTDRDGSYEFDLKLPGYFAGRPLSQGAARVLIEVTVKDSAGHAEGRREPITVSETPLLVTAVPEGGTLIPGLENQVFLLTSYPDGTPARTELTIQAGDNADQRAVTDDGGVAVIRIKAGAGTQTLTVEATDREGNRASSSVPLQKRGGQDQILLRTERAVYPAGDAIRMKVFSTLKRGTAYVDIVKEGQTILTRDLDIENGQAELTLAAKQPGFAKVFFYLEQEVLKPRYEIHSIGMPEVVAPVEESQGEQHDRAARALFSATEMVTANKFETEFGRTVPQTKYDEYAKRYQTRFLAQVRSLSETLGHAYAESTGHGDLIKTVERMTRGGAAGLRDAGDTNLRMEQAAWDPNKTHYLVRSAGPDKQFGTPDDLWTYVEVRRRKIVGRASSGASAIAVNIEDERGSFNERAEIVGTAVDQWGGALEGASVELRSIRSGKMRRASVGADGQFRLGAVPAGNYQIGISSDSGSVSSRLELNPRDRAVLSVLLRQEHSGTIVAVSDMGRMVADFKIGFGVAGGVPGGVAGGQMGGVIGGVIGGMGGAPLRTREVDFFALAPPAAPKPMAQMVAVDRAEVVAVNSATLVKEKDESGSVAPRVRSYFPEALYINPEIITDKDGVASTTIPLADSITTWRMAMMASTAHGALGSSSSSIKVF